MPRPKKSGEHTNVNTSSAAVFAVLRHISTTDRPLGVAELHRMTGEPTSSTHRALMTLEEAGYAARFGASAKFGPGPMAYHIIRAMIARFPVRRGGMPLLRRIVAITDAAATLNARVGWFGLRVGWAEGHHEFFQQRRIGEARLLHTDVAPLAMLASMDRDMVAAYRSDVSARWPSEAKAVRSPAMGRALSEAKEKGYMVRPDKLRSDRSWVAFALSGEDGIAHASVAFAMKDSELPSRSRTPEIFRRVRDEVATFQGYVASRPEEIATPYDHLPPSEIDIDLVGAPSDGDTPSVDK